MTPAPPTYPGKDDGDRTQTVLPDGAGLQSWVWRIGGTVDLFVDGVKVAAGIGRKEAAKSARLLFSSSTVNVIELRSKGRWEPDEGKA